MQTDAALGEIFLNALLRRVFLISKPQLDQNCAVCSKGLPHPEQ